MKCGVVLEKYGIYLYNNPWVAITNGNGCLFNIAQWVFKKLIFIDIEATWIMKQWTKIFSPSIHSCILNTFKLMGSMYTFVSKLNLAKPYCFSALLVRDRLYGLLQQPKTYKSDLFRIVKLKKSTRKPFIQYLELNDPGQSRFFIVEKIAEPNAYNVIATYLPHTENIILHI